MIEKAKWITAGADVSAPCIRKKIQIEEFDRAKLYVTGLGYFLCEINGVKITEDLFMPVASDYKKRELKNLLYPCYDKEFTHRVYYMTFDVSSFLCVGENVLDIYLGNGWFNQNKRTIEGDFSFDNRLIARFALTVKSLDGREQVFLSDGTEKWRKTEVVENNLFYGERQDARLFLEERPFHDVQVYSEFQTEFTEQKCPNERVIRVLTPRLLSVKGSKRVYDAGENVSGYASVRAKGNYGDELKVVYAGAIDKDGGLDAGSTGAFMENNLGEKQLQEDRFVLDGNERVYRPKFTKHCFRYFETDGELLSCEVEVVHTKCDVTASFISSSEVLNFIYEAYVRTQLNNLHDGYPSDCPHRERLGYTGDGQITARSAMLTLDTEEFYRKWIRDITDSQNKQNGHVQYTAPFMGGAGGPGGWGGAIVFVPYDFYRRFGDKKILTETFTNMLLWVEYMEAHTENGLVTRAEKNGYCLGDWGFPEKIQLPKEYVNTAFLILGLIKMQEIAKVIGREEAVAELIKKSDFYKDAIVKEFYDKTSGRFCDGVQGADAFALEIGLGDRKLAEVLANEYREKGGYNTGIFGTYFLTKALFDYGFSDVAYKLLTDRRKPSYGYLMEQGATTLYENLLMTGSDCHPMFGSVVELFFTRIMGLPFDKEEGIVIEPKIPRGLRFAKASIFYRGKKLCAEFVNDGAQIVYSVILPFGEKGRLTYNGKTYDLTQGENKITIKSYN